MPDPAHVSPRSSPPRISIQKLVRVLPAVFRRTTFLFPVCLVIAQSALADSVTYNQLQQGQTGRARVTSTSSAGARNQEQQANQSQNPPAAPEKSEPAGSAEESPDHPEFVRLPDGRIVRYGPGILCDENCVEPMTPAAFREPGPRIWWLVPAVSGAALCAFLCRGDEDTQPQPTPTIIIPPQTPDVTPTVAPSPQPSPEVPEVPEPGTLVLFGLGIGALIARRRRAVRKDED